jgi:hypothetical protein
MGPSRCSPGVSHRVRARGASFFVARGYPGRVELNLGLNPATPALDGCRTPGRQLCSGGGSPRQCNRPLLGRLNSAGASISYKLWNTPGLRGMTPRLHHPHLLDTSDARGVWVKAHASHGEHSTVSMQAERTNVERGRPQDISHVLTSSACDGGKMDAVSRHRGNEGSIVGWR